MQPREILIDGKAPGTVSLIVWAADRRKQYDIVVEPAITTLEQQLQALFPGEDIAVSVSEEAIVLSGQVSSTNVMLRAGEIATASASKAKVINLLQVPGGSESQQVMLQVRFAEVNRRALTELGLRSSRSANGSRRGRRRSSSPRPISTTTEGARVQRLPEPVLLRSQEGIGGVLRALEQKGGFQSLAEPNLIAYNGQEASFLAGGEFPVPIVQGATGAVTIEFKEFGIRLNFTPTIAGDVIRLKVTPEVSTLDFANGHDAVRLPDPCADDAARRNGRRAARRPVVRDCGPARQHVAGRRARRFRSSASCRSSATCSRARRTRAEQTELMVLITPRLVRPLDPDEVPPLPTNIRPFLKKGDIGGQLEGGGGVGRCAAGRSVAEEGERKQQGQVMTLHAPESGEPRTSAAPCSSR